MELKYQAMDNYKIEPYGKRNFRNEDAYLRAEKRLKDLKGFYWHAFWYVAVNIFIIILILSNGGQLFHFGTWSTPLFWGIGLGFHAIGVFGKNRLFGKSWEERKIKEFMEREEQESRNFE